jgi:glycosyltransferase involved in cell wall biosynthesis
MSPLISVIIPVFNVEEYLQRCLNSLVSQTYDNFEVILIDDGSPDNSPKICDDYKKRDCRFQVIHQSNQGLSAARNRGLDIAKGDFVTFIDSDDWVSADYLSELYSLIKNTQADIAIASHQLTTTFPAKEKKTKSAIKSYTQQEALFELIAKQNQPFVISCGKLYRKKLFNNIRFPIGKYHEDEYTSHHLINEASKISYSNKVLYFYYQRPGSITKQNHRSDVIDAFKDRLNFVIANKLDDLIPFAASNLCWQYLNLCYEMRLNREDYSDTLYKAKEIRHLMRLRKITDLFLFIFFKQPKLYFFIKKHKY